MMAKIVMNTLLMLGTFKVAVTDDTNVDGGRAVQGATSGDATAYISAATSANLFWGKYWSDVSAAANAGTWTLQNYKDTVPFFCNQTAAEIAAQSSTESYKFWIMESAKGYITDSSSLGVQKLDKVLIAFDPDFWQTNGCDGKTTFADLQDPASWPCIFHVLRTQIAQLQATYVSLYAATGVYLSTGGGTDPKIVCVGGGSPPTPPPPSPPSTGASNCPCSGDPLPAGCNGQKGYVASWKYGNVSLGDEYASCGCAVCGLKLACWDLCCDPSDASPDCETETQPKIDTPAELAQCEDASQPTSVFAQGPGNIVVVSDPTGLCDEPPGATVTQTMLDACQTIMSHGTRMYHKTGVDAAHPFYTGDTKAWAVPAAALTQYLASPYTLHSELADLKTFAWTVGSNVAVDNTCPLTGSLFTMHVPMGTTSKSDTLSKVLMGVNPDEYCLVSTAFGQYTGQTDDPTSDVTGDMVTIMATYPGLLAMDHNLKNLGSMLHFMYSSTYNSDIHQLLP